MPQNGAPNRNGEGQQWRETQRPARDMAQRLAERTQQANPATASRIASGNASGMVAGESSTGVEYERHTALWLT
jgi:hypothetical protein